jgi:hypothetical protein
VSQGGLENVGQTWIVVLSLELGQNIQSMQPSKVTFEALQRVKRARNYLQIGRCRLRPDNSLIALQ